MALTGRVVVTTLALSLMALAAEPTSTSAAERVRVRHYRGETSEGGPLVLRTRVSNGVATLAHLEMGAALTCEDGTQTELGFGITWGNAGPELVEQRLDLREVSLDFALLASGRLGAHRGSGTMTMLWAQLTTDEQPQLCTTGDLTWVVERQAEPARRVGELERVHRIDGSGRRVAVRLSTGSVRTDHAAPTSTSSPPLRHYRGRTSEGRAMEVVTRRTDDGVLLREFSSGWTMSCQDGSEFVLGASYSLGGSVPMAPGRLDFDSVGSYEALHVHGQLGSHAGSGTVSQAWPALTEDLQAQLCTSGEQTWRLWRIDAGYAPEPTLPS